MPIVRVGSIQKKCSRAPRSPVYKRREAHEAGLSLKFLRSAFIRAHPEQPGPHGALSETSRAFVFLKTHVGLRAPEATPWPNFSDVAFF